MKRKQQLQNTSQNLKERLSLKSNPNKNNQKKLLGRLCTQLQIDNFMEQLKVSNLLNENTTLKATKQNLHDQLTISQMNDYKVSPINRDNNFNDKEGNPCSSIKPQIDSDISVQGLSPFLLNKDHQPQTNLNEKSAKSAISQEAAFAKKSKAIIPCQQQAEEKPSTNNVRIMISKKHKKKALNGFKKSIESQKEYIESRMHSFIQQQQKQKVKEAEKREKEESSQLKVLIEDPNTEKYYQEIQDEPILQEQSSHMDHQVRPFQEDSFNQENAKVAQFIIEEDAKDYDHYQLLSPTFTSTQKSKIFLFSNPTQSPKTEVKRHWKQPQVSSYQKQRYLGQTEQTQESSGEDSELKEKEEKDESEDSKIVSQHTLALTQTAKQKSDLNSLIQSPCMIKAKFDNTLTQKKDPASSMFYSTAITNGLNSHLASGKSVLKISSPTHPLTKFEQPNQQSQSTNQVGRHFLFKINKTSGNLLKKESNFGSQIKLLQETHEPKYQPSSFKPSAPFKFESKKDSHIYNSNSILNLKFKEQQRKVQNFLQKTLSKN